MKSYILTLLLIGCQAFGQTAIKPLTQENIEAAITDPAGFRGGLGILEDDNAAINAAIATDPQASRDALNVPMISVKDFGAVGDGVADDTEEFEAAVAAAKVAKWPLFVPAGNYLITDPIVLDWEAASIIGVSAGIGGSNIITASTTNPIISIPGDYNHVKVQNLRITGPGRATSTGRGIDIRGDLGGATNVDFGLIADCRIIGFDVGIYWRGVANSTIDRTGVENCRLAVHSLGNNNSNTFQNCAFVAANGSLDAVGVWLEAGRGTVIESCDFGGPTMALCVEDNAVATAINGGQWEAYGTGLKTTSDTSVPVVSGVMIGYFGTPSADRYSMDLQVGATVIGGLQSIVSTTYGSAIKMRSTITRGLRVFGSAGSLKADFFGSSGTVYNHTACVSGSLGLMTQANGESASANTLGVGWLRESPGSNLIYNFGVRDASNNYAWANLLDFHFLKAAASNSNPAFIGVANSFTASQSISNAIAPNLKFHTGTDTLQQRFALGIATASDQFVVGAVANDTCLVARSGGSMTFSVGPTSTNQAIVGRFKASGRFNLTSSAVPNYADDTAADAALSSGDLYTTTAGGRTVYRKP
jgi:hypothetical protein